MLPSAPTHSEATERIAPIPTLHGYYPDAAARPEWTQRIFDETAPDYDRVESWLSLGSGRRYRRTALARAGLGRSMRVADVGCGTGLLAREAVSLVGPSGSVVGVDPSPGMLALARESLNIDILGGRAEALPLESASFDFVTMGYALRHVEDLHAAFREFARVLRPGGRVCILEITRPRNRIAARLLRAQLDLVCGFVCRVVRTETRTAELWRYFGETIDRCVPPEKVVDALGRAGFHDAGRFVSLGVFSEYTATRP